MTPTVKQREGTMGVVIRGSFSLSCIDSQVKPWGPATHTQNKHPEKKLPGLKSRTSKIQATRWKDFWAQFFQSQTWAMKFAMLTFLVLMSSIQGCSSIRQGVARRGGSFSRLGRWLDDIRYGRKRHRENIPAFNKVLEVVGPFNAVFGFVLQLGNRLADDISQEVY